MPVSRAESAITSDEEKRIGARGPASLGGGRIECRLLGVEAEAETEAEKKDLKRKHEEKVEEQKKRKKIGESISTSQLS